MAKKKTSTPKTETAARIQRTEAYANQVRAMFAATVNQILALNKSLPKLEPGVMFSFDAQSLKMQKQVEGLLRQLHSVATMAIQNGIKLEWGLANQATDSLLKNIIGKKAMSDPTFNAWTARNNAAMNAFINRSEKGLNLSDRVWKSVLQLREEMEVAITVAVGEGKSAQKMSQDVRQYLNDPDLMFRRFRYKDPKTGEWRRKWKKRIKTPDGTYRWIDYDRDSYKTGSGVYKSAAKNAMRVARTETNIAYRRADNARWQEMDFVLGQRIQLSGDHPKKDICDKLAGDYPKDFVFDGWHPQCFCYVTPITLPPEETAHLTEMMLNGEDWRSELKRLKRGREITSYPENFKSWVRDNAENIEAARERGTLPYFISNNQRAINQILNPSEEVATSPLKIENSAILQEETQHKEEHIAAVTSKYGERVLDIMGDIPGIDTSALKEAIKAGDTAAISLEAQKLRDIGKGFKADAKTALNSAAQYGEVSGAELEAAITTGNIKEIWQQTKALQKKIETTKQAEADLGDIIPDAHEWHKQFTLSELQATKDAVKKTLASMPTDLRSRKDKLEFEITWVEDKKKYPTWTVAKAAYEKELARVNREIDIEAIKTSVTPAITFAKTQSENPELKALALAIETDIANPAVTPEALKLKADQLIKKYNEEFAKVKDWMDLLSRAKPALDYAMRSKDSDYITLAAEINNLLNAKSGSITAATKKVDKLIDEYKKQIGGGTTLEDLKKGLGENMPATLKNLQKLIDKNKGGWDDDEIEEMRTKMLELFENSDFGMNVPRLSRTGDEVLDSLFNSYFKSQPETQTGLGAVDPKMRMNASHALFGTEVATTPLKGYEKYGFLMDKDILKQANSGIAGQYWRYGDGIQIRFKKDRVIATFTMEDSLHSGLNPSLTTDPQPSSFGDMRIIGSSTSPTSAIQCTRDWASSYIELQYHGDLTLDCIESIYIPEDVISKISTATMAKIKAVGCPIFTTDSKGNLIHYK